MKDSRSKRVSTSVHLKQEHYIKNVSDIKLEIKNKLCYVYYGILEVYIKYFKNST